MNTTAAAPETTGHIATFIGLSADDVTAAKATLAKLAKRATRAKVPGADTLTLTATPVIHTETDSDGFTQTSTTYDVTITGEIGMGGTVTGVITWSTEGVVYENGLVTPLNGQPIDTFPAPTRTCHHCGTARDRHRTVYVEVNGTTAEYGTACLGLVAGITATDSVAGILAHLDRLARLDDDALLDGPRTGTGYAPTVETFVRVVLAELDTRPYMAATGTGEPTGQWVYNAINHTVARTEEDTAKTLRDHAKTIPAATVTAAIDHITNLAGSDYTRNVTAALTPGFVTRKTSNLIASAVNGYLKATGAAMERAAREAAINPAAYGAPGDKLRNVTGTVVGLTKRDGDYGTTELVKIALPTGQILAWFASSVTLFELGDTIIIKSGTVKSYDTDRKETKITRCRTNHPLETPVTISFTGEGAHVTYTCRDTTFTTREPIPAATLTEFVTKWTEGYPEKPVTNINTVTIVTANFDGVLHILNYLNPDETARWITTHPVDTDTATTAA